MKRSTTFFSLLVAFAFTQVSAQDNFQDQTTQQSLDEKHEIVAAELRVAMLQESEKEDQSDDATTSDTTETTTTTDASEVELLKQIDVLIAQQKTATASLQDIKSKHVELENEAGRFNIEGVDGGPPYSILILDQLNDSIASGKAKKDSSEATLLAARDAVERSRLSVEDAKKARRQWKDAGGDDTDPQAKTFDLKVTLAEEALILDRQQLDIEKANADALLLEAKLEKQKLDLVSQNVTFSKQTLNEKLAELDVRERELKRRAETIQAESQYAERRWLAARQELDASIDVPASLLERVEALKVTQQTVQIEQTTVNQRLQRLPMMRTSWQRRYEVTTGQANRQQERKWLDETEEQLEQLAREKEVKLMKLLETREIQASVAAKMDALDADETASRRWLDSNFQSLSKQVELYNGGMLGIDSATRALSRLKVDIEGMPSRSVGELAVDTWALCQRLWNYELTSTEDISITVGKIVSSLLFLVFGYLAAKLLSSLLGNRLPKIGVDEAGAHAIESLAFYALLITFALAALRYANVPLTVFTFLGGAIAIGIGFGSQNILNNFISGLILLAERPIKAGDLILVDEIYGNVKSIGARSTTIRTGDNLDIIIPNSKFLENDVVNLTRRDDKLRTSITVGVAYGSPLDEVMRLLELAASDNPNINERPKPIVWFNDFGDNALVFQVHFWINARTVTQMRKVETDVRLKIDRLFRESNICIAFPQRDLHIQSLRPIEFRMVGDENAA